MAEPGLGTSGSSHKHVLSMLSQSVILHKPTSLLACSVSSYASSHKCKLTWSGFQDHLWPHLSEEVFSTITTKLTPEVLSPPKANKPRARLQLLQELRMLINSLKSLDKNSVS